MASRSAKGFVRIATIFGLGASALGVASAGWFGFDGAESAEPTAAAATASPAKRKAAGRATQPARAAADQAGGRPADGEVELAAPSIDGWRPRHRMPRPKVDGEYRYYAVAYYFDAPIFSYPSSKPRMVGYVRRDTFVPAKRVYSRKGCKGGHWYRVKGGGYICSKEGFVVSSERKRWPGSWVAPRISQLVPFRYIKADPNAVRLYRPPRASEWEKIEAAGPEDELPDVVELRMKGDYLLAINRAEQHHQQRFLRTVRGRYIHQSAVAKKFDTPAMRGEHLTDKRRLPLAFVFGADRPLLRLRGKKLVRAGIARKHARFSVARVVEVDGTRYVRSSRGLLLPRDQVRVAKRISPPAGIGAKERWIHIDLAQQVLVAYRGKRPVFATLVSSGKKGFDTPTGLYRIHHKHISTTMKGSSEEEGVYEVEEVPWALYYHEGYAIHGAYWHNRFGQTKSHGCTNVAPADARWLFFWTQPAVPAGWHARLSIKSGVRVYFTGSAS